MQSNTKTSLRQSFLRDCQYWKSVFINQQVEGEDDKDPRQLTGMSRYQFLMKSAATIIHIKITVKTTDEKYYLVFGGEGGDKGVACWSGILADNCVRSPDTIKTDFKILSIIGKDDEEH